MVDVDSGAPEQEDAGRSWKQYAQGLRELQDDLLPPEEHVGWGLTALYHALKPENLRPDVLAAGKELLEIAALEPTEKNLASFIHAGAALAAWPAFERWARREAPTKEDVEAIYANLAVLLNEALPLSSLPSQPESPTNQAIMTALSMALIARHGDPNMIPILARPGSKLDGAPFSFCVTDTEGIIAVQPQYRVGLRQEPLNWLTRPSVGSMAGKAARESHPSLSLHGTRQEQNAQAIVEAIILLSQEVAGLHELSTEQHRYLDALTAAFINPVVRLANSNWREIRSSEELFQTLDGQ